MKLALTIIHVIISLVLIIIVLMQHGKQQGLSGAIAGGAETFFGKNKGRTVDAMLKKITAIMAALFIITSVSLAYVGLKGNSPKAATPDASAAQTQTQTNGAANDSQNVKMDDKGNLVDDKGNVLVKAEDVKKAQSQENTNKTDNSTKTTDKAAK